MKKLIIFFLLVGGFAKAAKPPTPTGFVISAKTHNSISIKWNAVAAATNFEVQISENNSTSYQPIILLKATDLNHVFQGLKSSTIYFVRVLATNKDGKSLPAETKDVTNPAPLAEPNPPNSLLTTATLTQINLSWKDGGGGQPDSYTWQCSNTADFAKIIATGSTAAKSATITGLNVNTPYYLRVYATNKTGNSKPSSTKQQSTLNPYLPFPNDFRILNFGTNIVNLGWTLVSGADRYEIIPSKLIFSTRTRDPDLFRTQSSSVFKIFNTTFKKELNIYSYRNSGTLIDAQKNTESSTTHWLISEREQYFILIAETDWTINKKEV